MATNVPGWDDLKLVDLKYHDVIWFNALREFQKYKARKGTSKGDPVLDQLIRQGLIDWNVDEASAATQQVFRYSACMAGRLTSHSYRLEESVCSPSGQTCPELNIV